MTTQTRMCLFVAIGGLGVAAAAVLLNSATPVLAQAKTAVIEPTEKPLMEGPIHYVAFEQESGRTAGFTRVDDPKAVPGGNGSWNERRYGKLYRDYLVVTKPADKSWGVLVLPASRLQAVHFAQE